MMGFANHLGGVSFIVRKEDEMNMIWHPAVCPNFNFVFTAVG